MSDEEKQELISKLAESWDNLNLLQHMQEKEQSNLEHKLRITNETRSNIGNILYKLTGNIFYKPKEETKNENN